MQEERGEKRREEEKGRERAREVEKDLLNRSNANLWSSSRTTIERLFKWSQLFSSSFMIDVGLVYTLYISGYSKHIVFNPCPRKNQNQQQQQRTYIIILRRSRKYQHQSSPRPPPLLKSIHTHTPHISASEKWVNKWFPLKVEPFFYFEYNQRKWWNNLLPNTELYWKFPQD